ncbi:MAG: right-handed parallel beta-helix repeat-containing protein, partial [Armatimonadota bacterium]
LPILPEVVLKPGMVIDHSVRVKPGVYRLPNSFEDGRAASITIKGKGTVIDFSGVTLEGTAQDVDPDKRQGTGLIVSGSGIQIIHAKIRGFKIGVLADKCDGLIVKDSDLSYNWKQHLKSTSKREDEDDWQSYHQNEKDEWFRYGAALYLRDCSGFEIKGVTATGGNCGVMLNRSNSGLIWNNNLSYLSGIGLGMYRSSDNRVMNNRIDFCVRGYSHNVYNRGQDSAGILIYEQSNHNLFAYNSVTHGGDGFFLWAGQSTMDTGKGGCNDNLLYGNDFSHAVTNGIEATFSRNIFANNLVQDCWHGVWGGYSFKSGFLGNYFKKNVVGMAIEHGQDNRVLSNVFNQDGVGVQIWANTSQDPNWGYAKQRDTKSRDWTINDNVFIGNNEAVNVLRTSSVKAKGNNYEGVKTPWVTSESNGIDHGQLPTGPGPANIKPQAAINDDYALSDLDYSRQWSTPWVSGYDGSAPAVQGQAVLDELIHLAPKPLPGSIHPFLSASKL